MAMFNKWVCKVMGLTTESKHGSNCSGTDGTVSRTLTMSNVWLTVDEGFSLFVDGLNLVIDVDFTVTHLYTGSLIKFNNIIFNSQHIEINYCQTAGRG